MLLKSMLHGLQSKDCTYTHYCRTWYTRGTHASCGLSFAKLLAQLLAPLINVRPANGTAERLLVGLLTETRFVPSDLIHIIAPVLLTV